MSEVRGAPEPSDAGGSPVVTTTSGDAVRVRPPGMYDVARRAGVSHQTVSRVINAQPNVSEATRERVLVAISDLGYRRNTAARTLVTSRSRTIGVALLGSALFGPASTLLSVETAARRAGYFVSMVSLRETEVGSIAASFEHFMDQAVEGIVVIAPQVTVMDAARELAGKVPLVVIASDLPNALGCIASPLISSPAPGWRSVTSLISGTAPSPISPDRTTGSTPEQGCAAGGRNWATVDYPFPRYSTATGLPRAVTTSVSGCSAADSQMRSSPPTTTWVSASFVP